MQPDIVSSGYILFRLGRPIQFLLLKHPLRWDLPKGHLDEGETPELAALRELEEETGISRKDIWTDPSFVFKHQYQVKWNKKARWKELIVFLGWLQKDSKIRLTEHDAYQWFDWSPPHRMQPETIDPLLQAVHAHMQEQVVWPPEAVR